MQTQEDLKYLRLLDEIKLPCFQLPVLQSNLGIITNILLTVLNRVYTVTSLDL